MRVILQTITSFLRHEKYRGGWKTSLMISLTLHTRNKLLIEFVYILTYTLEIRIQTKTILLFHVVECPLSRGGEQNITGRMWPALLVGSKSTYMDPSSGWTKCWLRWDPHTTPSRQCHSPVVHTHSDLADLAQFVLYVYTDQPDVVWMLFIAIC